ncbi:MAG: TatD family hydrolase [bacterium]
MQLVDTHCHFDLPVFDPDRVQILRECHTLGINQILVPAIRRTSWDRLLAVCSQHPGLYPALGLHPMFTAEHRDEDIDDLARQAEIHRPVAIGEIGLDFYQDNGDRERQVQLFEEQLRIAANLELPVVLHVRKAYDEVLHALRNNPVIGGTCHAFNGSQQQAHQYLEMGFKLGFGGMLTYERSTRLRKLAKELPLESIVLETDAPDMSPESLRGQRNTPATIAQVVQVLAEIRGINPEDAANATTENAAQVFTRLKS